MKGNINVRDEKTDSKGTFRGSSATKTELGFEFVSISKARALYGWLLLCAEQRTGAGVCDEKGTVCPQESDGRDKM